MLRFALANLASRPGRTALAAGGLTIAIAGMVGLFSIAEGLDALLDETFGPIPGLLVMQPGAPVALFSTLPAEWGDELAQIEGVHVVTPEVWTRINTVDGRPILAPPRFLGGIDIPSRLRLRKPVITETIIAGRFLTHEDAGSANCVISRQVSVEFDKQAGGAININGYAMEVVGVHDTGSMLLDATVWADMDLVRRMGRIDSGTVSNFYIEPEAGVTNEAVIERVEERFRGRAAPPPSPVPGPGGPSIFDLSPLLRLLKLSADAADQALDNPDPARGGGENQNAPQPQYLPLDVRPVAEMAERFDELTDDMDLILGFLTTLGVLIAVFSILNTMLMSVTERTVEFGILRANGWSRGDVLRLITGESAVLGLIGGACGVLLGWGTTHVVNSIWADRVHLYAGPGLLAISLLLSILLGILGGLYPALRAARLSPMEAIRRG